MASPAFSDPRLASVRLIATRAYEEQGKGRDLEACTLYSSAAEQILEIARDVKDEVVAGKLRERMRDYLTKAELLKARLDAHRAQAPAHVARRHEKTITIEEDAVGFGYTNVFHDWMQLATAMRVEDPYLQRFHQCQNLLRLCELVVLSGRVKRITVLTKKSTEAQEAREQGQWFGELQASLEGKGVSFQVSYEANLHDRSVEFNNGWLLRLGRGLDYFKPVGKFALGYHDLSARPCKQTTIDVLRDESLNRVG